MIVLIVRSGCSDVQGLARASRMGVQSRMNFTTSATAAAAPERPTALGYPGVLRFSTIVLAAKAGTDSHREQHHQAETRV